MRILFVDQFKEPGGAQLCLRDVIEEARARGWRTHLMVPGDGLPASVASYENGSKSIRDFFAFGIDTARAALAMRRAIHDRGINAVYVNGPRVLPAAAWTGSPLIFHAHSHLSANYARSLVRLALRARHASVIAASNYVAEPLRGATDIRVIYNGVADQSFFARSFSSQKLTVGIVGRVSPEKGHLDFMLAAGRIASLFPATKFLVYGAEIISRSGYEAEVRRAAAGLNVDFRGWTNDVAEALQSIDILAVPSAPIESTTRVIPEAFSAGTPVIAYAAGGIPEIVRNGHTAILSETTPEALSEKIVRVMRDRDLMRRLAVNGRIEWERRFHKTRFTNDVCDSLAKLMAKEATARRCEPLAAASPRDRASASPGTRSETSTPVPGIPHADRAHSGKEAGEITGAPQF